MRLKELVINDLYSFGRGVLIPFVWDEEKSKTLICGVNHDDAGADSNGAGKSNVLNVLFWTVLGEVFQKENIGDIVRHGQKSASAKLTVIDGENELVIERGTGSRKFLKLWYNKEDKTCRTDTETENVLRRYLNISPTLKPKEVVSDFVNTCYFSSDTVKGFMAKETTSKERFAVIERYLGLKRYSLASGLAKEERRRFMERLQTVLDDITAKEAFVAENPVENMEHRVLALRTRLSEYEGKEKDIAAQIENSREHTEIQLAIPRKQLEMGSLKSTALAQIHTLEAQFEANDKRVSSLEQEMREYAKLSDLVLQQGGDSQRLLTRQKEISDLQEVANTTLRQAAADAQTLGVEIANLRTQITTHYKCPKCSADVMVKNGKLSAVDVPALTAYLSEKEEARAKAQKGAEAATKELGEIRVLLEELRKKLEEYAGNARALSGRKNREVLVKEIQDLTELNRKISEQHAALGEQTGQKIQTITKEIADMEERIKSLPYCDSAKLVADLDTAKREKSGILMEIGKTEEQIRGVQAKVKEISDLKASVSEQKKKAETFGFWETGFQEIKIDIIEDFLPDFEDKVNEYLSRLRVDMQVDFDTQKMKANVTKKDKAEGRAFKEEFNVAVFRGKEPLPFGLLSKGQRSRVGSCVGMALRELTRERGSNVFDFFFLDEIADALDESGLRELVNLLDEVPGQKLIITHNDMLKNYISDMLTVEMSGGVSTVQN